MNQQADKAVVLNWSANGVPGSFRISVPQIIIGRQETCDVVIPTADVSRHHAQISQRNGAYYIEDLDSSLGTRLNGTPLRGGETLALRPGDEIQLGKQMVYFGDPERVSGQDFHLPNEFRLSQSKVLEEMDAFRSDLCRYTDEHMTNPDKSRAMKTYIEGSLDRFQEFLTSKLREYEVLQEITQILVRILDVKELLSTALELVSEVLGANRGFIILYDPKHGSLRSMIPRHFDRNDNTYEYDLSFSQTIARGCYNEKEIIIIDDALQDERFQSSQSIVASSIRSVICIPLQHGSEVSGVIYLDNLREVGLFKEHQTDFLRSFSCQTAIALENARLYTQAVTDGLTRLYNRKYINERIFEEMVRSRRYGRDCSLILLDVDRFKSVNDQHGHDFGDLVLTLVANVLRENARTSDVVARFGGEEFLLLLTETDLGGAKIFAGRLRESIENLNISHAGVDLKITVSAGVSTYHPDMRNEVTAFVKQADQALYHAKNSGRNKVCVYGEDIT